MNLPSRKTRDEKRAHWKKLVLKWKESGLSQTDFCKRENIAYGNFVRWRRRLKSSELKSVPTLIPVSIRPVVENASGHISIIRITMGDGKRIDLPMDISSEQLRAVVSSL